MTTPPAGRRRSDGRSRWILLIVAAGLVSALTAPGQTAGLSVFTDPLIEDLSISRTDISFSYFVATLLGATAQPVVGRAIDRWGPRIVTMILGVILAAVLFSLSFIVDVVGLTAGYVGLRMIGQGGLTLAATTAVARGIRRNRGLALGITSAIGSAGISLAPIGLEPIVSSLGAYSTWRIEALVVLVAVVTLALFFPGRRKRAGAPRTDSIETAEASWTLAQAMRSGMFWVIAASIATSGMLTTALGFHQIAVLGEQGLTPIEAAANFLPQTVTGLLSTLLAGSLADRLSPRILVIASMAVTIGALALLPVVSPGLMAVLYGLVLGSAGGALRGMEAAAYVRYYGVRYIGSIRGVAMSVGLAATAFGPILLAVGHDMWGNFTTPVLLSIAFPVAVIVSALIVRAPKAPQSPATPEPSPAA